MRTVFVVLIITGIIVISGCISQSNDVNKGVITQYVCPDKTIVDNPDICPKQEETQYAKPVDAKPVDILQIPQYEDLDCFKPENQNITYVKIEVTMETDNTSVNPNYRWYPSLNEGRINSVSSLGYNKGCTKIFIPETIVQFYIMKNEKVIFYNEVKGDITSLGGSDYSFPKDSMVITKYLGIVVNEKGKYKAIVIVRNNKNGKIIGGNEDEFEM